MTVGEAARACGIAPTRFAQMFARTTGLPFTRYLARFRLEQAAYELQSSDIMLDELAQKWGFCDKSHLVKRFHDYYRMTPGEYRARFAGVRPRG